MNSVRSDRLSALRAQRLLERLEGQIATTDDAVLRSRLDKETRKAWRRFVSAWRQFYYEEKDSPSRSATRGLVMFATQFKDWRRVLGARLKSARPTDAARLGFSIVARWRPFDAVDAEVLRLDGAIRSGRVRAAFARAWDAFASEWRTFRSLHRSAGPPLPGWRKVYAYQQRTAEWRDALARERTAT
jgi:hypothetical protein